MVVNKKLNVLFFDLFKLQYNFEATFVEINELQQLVLNNSIGKGSLTYLPFGKGLAVLNINVTLQKEIVLDLSNNLPGALHFIFCLEGSSSHTFGDTPEKELKELQSLITSTDYNVKNTLCLKPGIKNSINIIYLDKKEFFEDTSEDTLPAKSKLRTLFNVLDFSNKKVHIDSYNIKIGSYVKDIINTKKDFRVSERMHFKGNSFLILAGHIKGLYNDSLQPENTSNLSFNELNKVSLISELIKKNPQEQHSVASLCKLSGLSPAKLQAGCKKLNKRTISDFVRYVRLNKAEELIRTTDLNISEIVYSIGFISRSYFCKIFKNEFGCSPKSYQQKIKKREYSV